MNIQNGNYFIGEHNVLELCSKYDTPLYVYDGEKIRSQYEKMLNAFSLPNLRINYACKALTNIAVLKLMKHLGAGIDAVSIEEIRLALHAGFDPQDIEYTPNGVSMEEIDAAIGYGVQLNVDNITTLEYIGNNYDGIPVGIRINPHVMAGGNSKISVGHIDSKFGISIHQMPLVRRIIEALGIRVNGIHMHTGSDILDIGVFLRASDILFEVARGFEDIDYIDFGSGFKVPYKADDIYTDIDEFGEAMSHKFKKFVKEYGKDVTLMFEPGKYLVSESGYFFATTNVVKQTTSTVFASLNTGFNHLIRPMFYNSYHDIVNVSNPNGVPRVYSVVGYICETDTFALDRRIGEITAGDILCFRNAGAYSFMMASNYNSRLLPAEVLLWNGVDHLVRSRQNFEQLLLNQVEVQIF